MLSFDAEEPTDDFWRKKLKKALDLRIASGLPSGKTNAFRLTHAEGDGVPGLVIDFYNDILIVQAHSAGMHHDRHEIAQALQHILPDLKAVYYKSQGTLPGK